MTGPDHALILGDMHGDLGAARKQVERARATGVEFDTIIQVGDAGVGPWPTNRGREGPRDRLGPGLARIARDLDVTWLITPGNHENYDTIDALPFDNEGRRVLDDRVLILPRGHRFTLGGVRFGSLGGAFSIDANLRVPGRSWWRQERITDADVAALGTEPLDVLVTHDVPEGTAVRVQFRLPAHLDAESRKDRELITRAVQRTRPHLVLAGHWHQRVSDTVRIAPDGRSVRVEVLDIEREPKAAAWLDLGTLEVSDVVRRPRT